MHATADDVGAEDGLRIFLSAGRHYFASLQINQGGRQIRRAQIDRQPQGSSAGDWTDYVVAAAPQPVVTIAAHHRGLDGNNSGARLLAQNNGGRGGFGRHMDSAGPGQTKLAGAPPSRRKVFSTEVLLIRATGLGYCALNTNGTRLAMAAAAAGGGNADAVAARPFDQRFVAAAIDALARRKEGDGIFFRHIGVWNFRRLCPASPGKG